MFRHLNQVHLLKLILYILNSIVIIIIVVVGGLNVHLNVPLLKIACINPNVSLKEREHFALRPVCVSVVPIKCAVTCPEVLV